MEHVTIFNAAVPMKYSTHENVVQIDVRVRCGKGWEARQGEASQGIRRAHMDARWVTLIWSGGRCSWIMKSSVGRLGRRSGLEQRTEAGNKIFHLIEVVEWRRFRDNMADVDVSTSIDGRSGNGQAGINNGSILLSCPQTTIYIYPCCMPRQSKRHFIPTHP